MEAFGIYDVLATVFGFGLIAVIAFVVGILIRSIAADEKDWRR